jgi:DNA-binding MarR family transcriptional regulator
MSQMTLMVYLIRHHDEQVCQKDLEKELGLKKASITGLIDRLTEKGYLSREQAEDDRRKNYIRLTQKALDYKEEIYSKFQELDEIMKKDFSPEELEAFHRISEKMEKNLNLIVKD